MDGNMRYRKVLAVITCVVLICGSAQGQGTTTVAGDDKPEVKTEASVGRAYLAEISGVNVYIRADASKVFYHVGQLNQGDKVIVHGEKFGWSQIEPVGPCFSYIARKHVKIRGRTEPVAKLATEANEAVEPNQMIASVPAELGERVLQGEVTADYVRVRAGSVKVPPDKADVVQKKLNKGDVVQIVGLRDDYYKIVPPVGVFFWVSSDYIRRLGPVTEEVRRELQARNRAVLLGKDPVQQGLQAERERQEYTAIGQLLEQQLNKPLTQRDFTEIRQRLHGLQNSAKSKDVLGRVEAVHRQLMRMERSLAIYHQSRKQDEQLRQTLAEIEKKIQQTMALESPPELKAEDIVVPGVLAPSAVFTKAHQNQRFLVLDDYQRIAYYAVSAKPGLDLNLWVGKKVSMIGKVTYDAFGKIRILNVSRIVELPGAN